MPRCLILDTYYKSFLDSLPVPSGSYEQELGAVLDRGFGTADFMSHALKAIGWEVCDVIANYGNLQRLWRAGQYGEGANPDAIAPDQIHAFRPDVVLLQDLSLFKPSTLAGLAEKYLLAGQISCALPDHAKVEKFECLFTSLPMHVPLLKSLGVPRVEYLPLAFDPRMLQCQSTERDIDISFVGGVGRFSHWKRGTDILEVVAERFGERFQWWGYGVENLANGSPLLKCYKGACWGIDQYKVYGRSRVVVNRHGEISRGYTNNLRCFEAQGMGALLMTELSPNFRDLFPIATAMPYTDVDDLIEHIEWAFMDDNWQPSAKRGQAAVIANHTYAIRMETVSRVLSECLERRKVAQ